MDATELANRYITLLTGAILHARAGRADDAQRLLGELDFAYAPHMPDALLAGIGQTHYLSGNALESVRWLQAVRKPDSVAKLALSAALTASGFRHAAARAQTEAVSDIGDQCAEDFLSDDESHGYRLPPAAWRGWGAANYALQTGDWDAAKSDYEQKCSTMPRFAIGADLLRTRSGDVPRWKGERTGRLVLCCSDGYGDTFMFGRYLAQMRERCDELILLAQRPVIELVRHSVPWLRVYPFNDAEHALRGADAYAYSWLLPSILRSYGTAQWLQSDGRIDLGPGRHVGIVWSGSGSNRYNRLRNIAVDELSPLFTLPGVTWHSLTCGPRASDECPTNVRDHNAELQAGGFLQTARLLHGLDLVVSIDSSVANLAGALGLPVWALVEADPDFRWGSSGSATPWYPLAKVFRQDSPGDWASVVRQVVEALQ